MSTASNRAQYALCLDNRRYRASLIVHKVYKVLQDDEAKAHGMIRVIDESGEDYLYSKDRFAMLDLPPGLKQKLASARH